MEWKLFDTDVPFVSTFEFHKDRERAPHLEQAVHRGRLEIAASLVRSAAERIRTQYGGSRIVKVVDLGCGDGGLMSLLTADPDLAVVGYDFQPSNVVGWEERGLVAQTFSMNFVDNWHWVIDADVYVITECLEHLNDPHEMVRRIANRKAYIVASSPYTEHAGSHDECHAWAWDPAGYEALMTTAGFKIAEHRQDGMFQIILGEL